MRRSEQGLTDIKQYLCIKAQAVNLSCVYSLQENYLKKNIVRKLLLKCALQGGKNSHIMWYSLQVKLELQNLLFKSLLKDLSYDAVKFGPLGDTCSNRNVNSAKTAISL